MSTDSAAAEVAEALNMLGALAQAPQGAALFGSPADAAIRLAIEHAIAVCSRVFATAIIPGTTSVEDARVVLASMEVCIQADRWKELPGLAATLLSKLGLLPPVTRCASTAPTGENHQ